MKKLKIIGPLVVAAILVAFLPMFLNGKKEDENAKFQRYHDYLYMAERQAMADPHADDLLDHMNAVEPYYDLYFNNIDFRELSEDNKAYYAKNYEYFKIKEKFMMSKNKAEIAEYGEAIQEYEFVNEPHDLLMKHLNSYNIDDVMDLELPSAKEIK